MNTWKPVVSRKVYKAGGQVDDLTNPLRKFETAQRAVARDAKWSKGHILTNSQQARKQQDVADLTGLGAAATLDLTGGGQVEGGPPGRDTVPVVAAPGGPTEAMLDNEEYVLPAATTELLGKPNLDNLVKQTTGQAPVGDESMSFKSMKFGMGGFFDRFRNRGKQIDDAVDAASNPEVAVVEPPAPKSTSMRDIMREIRKKNPPTQRKVRGYADGGQPSVGRKYGLRLSADQAQMLAKQEKGLPGIEQLRPAGMVDGPLANYRARTEYNRKQRKFDVLAQKEQKAEAAATEAPIGVPEQASSVAPVTAPQEPMIRRASPEDLVPMGDAAFSPANVAQARADAQAFETSKTAQQARTVKDIDADTAALRDLRRVRTNVADGRPAEYRKPVETLAAQPKLSDMISLANLQRGLNKDQQAAAQNVFSNQLDMAGEQRQQVKTRNEATDRYMEEAKSSAQELTTLLPWMGASTNSFFQKAAKINIDNPMYAANTLAGTVQGLEKDDAVLFKTPGDAGNSIEVTGKQAIALLNGEDPFGDWYNPFSGYGDDAIETLRHQALQHVQDAALREMAK